MTNKTTAEQSQPIVLKGNILALIRIEFCEEEDGPKEEGILCISGSHDLDTSSLSPAGELVRKDHKKIAQQIIKVEQCHQKWGQTNVLLLTDSGSSQLCLWACTPHLEVLMLLDSKTSSALAKDSYFTLLELDSKAFINDCIKGESSIGLLCRSTMNKSCTLHILKNKQDEGLLDDTSVNLTLIKEDFEDDYFDKGNFKGMRWHKY